MKKLLHAESYKLFNDKVFWITLAVVILFNFIVISGSDILRMPGYKVLSEIMKKEILTILISCIYGGLFIGGDFADRTLYHALIVGESRSAVLFAKAGIFVTAINVILYIFPLMLVIICTLRNGFGAALSISFTIHIILMIAALFTIGSAIGLFSLLAGVCFRDVGRTIGIPIILYFVMILLLNSPSAVALAHVFPAGVLILMVSDMLSPVYALVVGVIWSAILLICSVQIFRRAELY